MLAWTDLGKRYYETTIRLKISQSSRQIQDLDVYIYAFGISYDVDADTKEPYGNPLTKTTIQKRCSTCKTINLFPLRRQSVALPEIRKIWLGKWIH